MAKQSTISNDTSLAMLSEFDYFRPPVIQAAIVREWNDVTQATANSNDKDIYFNIQGIPNVYRDLSNTFLEVKVKLVKVPEPANEDKPLEPADVVAPVNYMLNSMFTDCEILVCGKRMTDKESHYPYRAMMETLLSARPEVLDTRETLAGWKLDKHPDLMDRVIAVAANNVEPNPAFVSRRKDYEQSRIHTLLGRLHTDLFHQDLDIPPNCKIEIKLTRAKDEFVLMAAENAKFSVRVLSAKMYVRSKEVNPEVIEAHRDMLQVRNFRLPLTRVNIKTMQIASGMSSASFPDLFKGKLPRRIVFGLVRQDRVSGKYNLNPFKFENFNLSQLALTLNGQPIPSEPLQTNYEIADYQRAYLNTLEALDLDVGNTGIVLTQDLWAAAYNLYAFKLHPGPIKSNLESTLTKGTVNVDFTFRSPTTAAIQVFVLYETNSGAEITANNEAFLLD
jgi:hypothetical protein